MISLDTHCVIYLGRDLPEKSDKDRSYYPGTEEAHTNPTRQRGECLRALAGASGSYVLRMRNFLAGVIARRLLLWE